MALDLHFNVVKSVVMRVGPRCNCYCAEFNLGTSILKSADNMKYFGIHMNAGSKFPCCYEHLKLRFYSSFNALYRIPRNKYSHSELRRVFSGREPAFTFATCHRDSVCLSSVCLLSVVRDVGAPYSGG